MSLTGYITREPEIPELTEFFLNLARIERYELPYFHPVHTTSIHRAIMRWIETPLRRLYKQLPENHEALQIQKFAADAFMFRNGHGAMGFCNSIAELGLENPPNPSDDARAYIYCLYASFSKGARDG